MRLMTLVLMMSFLLVASSFADAIDACKKQMVCQANHCQCTIPAEEGYDRFFTFAFSDIQKGKNYECHLDDTNHFLNIAYHGIELPEGVTMICNKKPCVEFPVVLSLDTHAMINDQNVLKIVVYCPATDEEMTATLSCTIKE